LTTRRTLRICYICKKALCIVTRGNHRQQGPVVQKSGVSELGFLSSTAALCVQVLELTRRGVSVHTNLEMNRIIPPLRMQALLAFRPLVRAPSSRGMLKPIRASPWRYTRSYSRPAECIKSRMTMHWLLPRGILLGCFALVGGSVYWVKFHVDWVKSYVDWVRNLYVEWCSRGLEAVKQKVSNTGSRLKHKGSECQDDEQSERRARRQTSRKSGKSRLERLREEHTPSHDENVNTRDGEAAASEPTTSEGSTDKQSTRSRRSKVSSALRRKFRSSRETHSPASSRR
jgi:hypothetical protein